MDRATERIDTAAPGWRDPAWMPGLAAGLALVLGSAGCAGSEEEARPTGRYSAVGGLDAAGQWLYVVGGGSDEGILQDAWRLEVATGRWEVLGDAPAPMLRGTASRDEADRLLVFGGEGQGWADLDGLWAWDLARDGWQDLGAGGPSVRKKHAAAWDGDQLWIHGGQHNDEEPAVILDDLWAWSEAGWDPVEAGLGPGAAWRQGLAFDPEGDRLWLHAGYDGTDTRTDRLWSRSLATAEWTEWSWVEGPPVRASHSFFWTPAGGCGLAGPVLVAWGGHASDDSLWCFDPAASTWTEAPPPGDAPLPRDAQVADLSPDGGSLVLACGDPASEDVADFVCDAWSLDLQSGAWTNLVPLD